MQSMNPMTWTGAIAALVLALLLTIIAVVVLILLGRAFRRFRERTEERPPPVEGPDPWTEAARRAVVDDQEPASEPGPDDEQAGDDPEGDDNERA